MTKEIIRSENAPKAVGPYSQAVRTGDTLYVSGQLPIDPETGKMPETAAEQARQSMANILAIVEAAGGSAEDICRCGIFMTDLGAFQAVNDVYASFFEGNYPARSTVQVAKLPLGAKVEIDAIVKL